MTSPTRTLLFGISIGINIAFFSVWGFFALEDTLDGEYQHHDRKWSKKKEKHKDDDRGKAGHWFYKEKLNVSDTQWAKIRPRMEAFHRKAHDLCKKINRKRNRLFSVLEDGDTSLKTVKPLREQIKRLQQRKQDLSVEYFRKKPEHLTDRQRRQFFRMMQRDDRCTKHTRFFRS